MERKILNGKVDFDSFIEEITDSGRYVSARVEKLPERYPCVVEFKVYKVRNFITKLIDETVVYNFIYDEIDHDEYALELGKETHVLKVGSSSDIQKLIDKE